MCSCMFRLSIRVDHMWACKRDKGRLGSGRGWGSGMSRYSVRQFSTRCRHFNTRWRRAEDGSRAHKWGRWFASHRRRGTHLGRTNHTMVRWSDKGRRRLVRRAQGRQGKLRHQKPRRAPRFREGDETLAGDQLADGSVPPAGTEGIHTAVERLGGEAGADRAEPVAWDGGKHRGRHGRGNRRRCFRRGTDVGLGGRGRRNALGSGGRRHRERRRCRFWHRGGGGSHKPTACDKMLA